MKNKLPLAAAVIGLGVAAAPAAAENPYRDIAMEFALGARRARVESVAVLPFSSLRGGRPGEGAAISEKLTTQLVRRRQVQVVERGMLDKVMDEHALGRAGMLDSQGAKQLGRLLAVDAIVTGSFELSAGELVVNARMIHLETGLILAAAERTIKRRDAEPDDIHDVFSVPVPEFTVAAPALDAQDFVALRDAPADRPDCSNAPARVDALEMSIVDLKARYWAAELKRHGLKQARANPGSTMTDPGLKKLFHELVRSYYDDPAAPVLSPAELERFREVDEKAFRLHRDCETAI